MMSWLAARWWIPASLLGGIAIAILLTNVPGGRTIYRFVPPVGIAFVALICFRDLARHDRAAFISIIGPAFALAVASIFAPSPLALWLPMASVGFVALFVFDPGPFRKWWWRHVLRRRVPNARRVFEYGLLMQVQAWADALGGTGDLSDEQVAAARQALDRMRELEPPNASWSALRDDYVSLGERWLLLHRDDDHADEAMELQRELRDLVSRVTALHEAG